MVSGFFSAYQRLSAEEGLQLNEQLGKLEPRAMREKVMQLTNPFIELGKRQGIQEGIQKGRQEGEVELVLRLLSRRLGALSAAEKRVIRKLDLEKIEALGESLLDFESRSDLSRWLEKNAS